MTVREKLIAAGALFLVWGVCAVCDPTMRPGYVAAIRDALIALGVFQATMTNPKGP